MRDDPASTSAERGGGSSSTGSSTCRPALFVRYPFLADRLPWVPILRAPTPCQRLTNLEDSLGAGPLWIKRDDLTALPYGGNKPRKLELILGEARARGARRLITFGALGSHHVLATAVYGRARGFAVTAVLVPQPVDDHVRQSLLAAHAQGARLVYAGATPQAAIAASRAWLSSTVGDGHPAYVIPPGGSSPVGSLGYVSAALELADQVRRGEVPPPDAIFVAGGSNGTAAGLLVGLRLAGLATSLVVVKVNDRLPVSAGGIAGLANGTARLLRRQGVGPAALGEFKPGDLDVLDQYLGAGYGHPTVAGGLAARELSRLEGVRLDQTYTGKTAAGFIDAARSSEWRGRTLLYWHTLNSHPLTPLLPDDASVDSLPEPFRSLL